MLDRVDRRVLGFFEVVASLPAATAGVAGIFDGDIIQAAVGLPVYGALFYDGFYRIVEGRSGLLEAGTRFRKYFSLRANTD